MNIWSQLSQQQQQQQKKKKEKKNEKIFGINYPIFNLPQVKYIF